MIWIVAPIQSLLPSTIPQGMLHIPRICGARPWWMYNVANLDSEKIDDFRIPPETRTRMSGEYLDSAACDSAWFNVVTETVVMPVLFHHCWRSSKLNISSSNSLSLLRIGDPTKPPSKREQASEAAEAAFEVMLRWLVLLELRTIHRELSTFFAASISPHK